MKKTLHKSIWRTLLVLAFVFSVNLAWADDPIYSVVGNNAAIFGAEWAVGSENTNMTLIDGIYQWTSEEFVVNGSTDVYYKVVQDHSWDNCWGGDYYDGNQKYTINNAGSYTMTFFFNEDTKAVSAQLYDIFTVAGSESLFGTNWNLLDKNNDMTNIDGIWTWTKNEVHLSPGTVYFKVVKGRDFNYGSWPENDYELNVPNDGVYNVVITFSNGQVSATLTSIPAVAHNTTNFPDDNFRNYLSNTFSTQTADGYWTPDELASVTSINCSNANISLLKGIEYFTALTELNCSGNKLTSIDLTSNTALTSKTLNGQLVTFTNIVKSITYNSKTYYFIWLNNQYNGGDLWFVDAIGQLDGQNENTQFDLNRVTWGEGCQVFTGTAQNNNNNPIGLQALSDGLPADKIAGKVLLVNGDANGGTFTYNYATTANRDGDSMEVTVNWQGSSVPTGIEGINAGEVKATRYYNMMGVESATPFQGVNIVVKEYSDGTSDTSKVIMR